MTVYQVTDPEFKSFGKIMVGYNIQPFLSALNTSTPLPDGTDYVAEDQALQSLPAATELGKALYGGIPVQFGWCNGHNTKLNCLEYHRDSEMLLGTEDFILLLAKAEEIERWKITCSGLATNGCSPMPMPMRQKPVPGSV